MASSLRCRICLDCLEGGIGPTRLWHLGSKSVRYPSGLRTEEVSPRYATLDPDEHSKCVARLDALFYPSYQDIDDEPKMSCLP